nr:immunoglobulin superfamily containing leucine-rich repeat protein 2-like [Lytechinus pictus]
MLAVNTTMNVSRVSSCLGILFFTMSLLLAEWPVKEVSGSLSSESNEGCILKNTNLGTKAICSHLHLKSVPQDLPSNAVTVDLSFNSIPTLLNGSFAYLLNITSLGLEHNVLSKIEHGAFEPLSHLRNLSLKHNRLDSLPSGLFRANLFLSILILGKNRLVSFPSSALPWSNSITTLEVSQNRIAFLDALDFDPLENCSLEKLYIGRNALHTLPFKVFSTLNTVKNKKDL